MPSRRCVSFQRWSLAGPFCAFLRLSVSSAVQLIGGSPPLRNLLGPRHVLNSNRAGYRPAQNSRALPHMPGRPGLSPDLSPALRSHPRRRHPSRLLPRLPHLLDSPARRPPHPPLPTMAMEGMPRLPAYLDQAIQLKSCAFGGRGATFRLEAGLPRRHPPDIPFGDRRELRARWPSVPTW